MNKIDELANEYAWAAGDDCLCDRTHPGTPVGECIYCFCGCEVVKAYKAGFKKARELATQLADQSPIHCQCAVHIEDMGKEVGTLKND